MQRREFITLLCSVVAAWPRSARAQQPERVRRIGVLMGFAERDSLGQAAFAAFRDGLEKLGWTEGRNIQIDTRWATTDVDSIQRFAKELVALKPELLVSTSTPTTTSLLQQSDHTDPVAVRTWSSGHRGKQRCAPRLPRRKRVAAGATGFQLRDANSSAGPSVLDFIVRWTCPSCHCA